MAAGDPLYPPLAHPLLDATGRLTNPWAQFFLRIQTANSGNAPSDAEYVVGATNSDLTNERVGTNTATAQWDFATAGQAKIDVQASATLDTISSTRGALLERGASGWAAITPGTAGYALVSNGAGADPSYQSVAADIQALLDGISTTQGAILYRNASDWVALTPGTSGQFLQTQGAAANPQWATASTADYVVMSDGANPASPLNDGNGNFLYIPYTA